MQIMILRRSITIAAHHGDVFILANADFVSYRHSVIRLQGFVLWEGQGFEDVDRHGGNGARCSS